ncbi:NUDIX hydrolase [Streptacidiphilus sp. EB103A]|uniref:NUDIX hydrolase n=1 Tax=Streptacidiphilus sp. EB103A TaxID=3156275 RepID=UPI003518541D
MANRGRWRRLDGKVLYSGGPHGRIHLAVDRAIRPDGVTVAYPHVTAPDSVRVVAVHRGLVPMVTQHHYLHDTEITDLPGGLVDEGESPVAAARRELAEETGLRAARLYPLGTVASARATSTETAHLFLAHDCTVGQADLDDGEAVETRWSTWNALADTDLMEQRHVLVPPLADGPSQAAVQQVGATMRAVGGPLPAPGAGLLTAAWAAFTVAALRDPIADEGLILVWLDLAIGRFTEGAEILNDLLAARQQPQGEQAWAVAAERLQALAARPD